MERQAAAKRSVKKQIILGIFIHNYRWGHQIRGDERGYIEKVKGFRDLGVDFFTVEKDPPLQEGMHEPVYVSLNLGRIGVPPTRIRELAALTLRALRYAVRRYPSRPIAIYAYNQDIENVWVAYILKKFVGGRLVIVYHQVRPAAFQSFGRGVVDRVRRGFHPVRAVQRSILPGLNRYAARHADVQIALSMATQEEVRLYLGIKNCAVVGNGLDTSKFVPLQLPKPFDVSFLGRLAPQKGIDTLLHAWAEVARRRPGSTMVLIGGGEPEDVSRYKRMVHDLAVEKSVTFAGFVEDSEIVRLLNSSKLFVFPSRKEGFAQAVSQAMGCGMCCILSDIPPLREVYGGAALFSPVDRPDLLANSICHMLDSQDERRALGIKARSLAETFSWGSTVRRELAQISGPR